MIIKFADPSAYPLQTPHHGKWHLIDSVTEISYETVTTRPGQSALDKINHLCQSPSFCFLFQDHNMIFSSDHQENFLMVTYVRTINGVELGEQVGFLNTTAFILNDNGTTIERMYG